MISYGVNIQLKAIEQHFMTFISGSVCYTGQGGSKF